MSTDWYLGRTWTETMPPHVVLGERWTAITRPAGSPWGGYRTTAWVDEQGYHSRTEASSGISRFDTTLYPRNATCVPDMMRYFTHLATEPVRTELEAETRTP